MLINICDAIWMVKQQTINWTKVDQYMWCLMDGWSSNKPLIELMLINICDAIWIVKQQIIDWSNIDQDTICYY